MSVRLRRLAADFETISRVFENHPRIKVLETEGNPPERYKIEYRLKGLAIQDGRVTTKLTHLAEVYLPLGYPRQAPQCRMLSPVYHPNIAPHAICIGDHWSAGESLAALMARIGELITYQSYNVKSPLNGEAARWAEQNIDRLPIEKVDLTVHTEAVRPVAPPALTPVRFPSARVAASRGKPFPYDAWLAAALAETAQDPEAPVLAPAFTGAIARLKEGSAVQAFQALAAIAGSTAVARLPQLHFLASLIRAAQGMPEKQIAALENATKLDDTYALAWQQLSVAAEATNPARAAEAQARFHRLG